MSSQLIKATVLAKKLGISRRTVSNWCKRDPGLALRRGRDWYVKIDALAKKDGLDPVKARTLIHEKWIPAVLIAKNSKISRKTMANWCASRPNFAIRIGRNWYISPEMLGATEEEATVLRKWVPDRRALATFVEYVGNPTQMDQIRSEITTSMGTEGQK